MQTGNISFCDKIALNIKSDATKKGVLSELEKYGVKILCRHFDIFREDISIPRIQKNPYMFCLKSNGNPYYMFLTRLNNINTCVMIDKKIQQGYFLPRMIIVHKMFNDSLFDNTLFEGEMVKDKSQKWIYMINDVVVHRNQMLTDVNLIKRHNLIYKTLSEMYTNDSRFFAIQVKRLFKPAEVEYAIFTFQNELNYTTRGLLFKPLFLKFKDILYNYDESLIKQTRKPKFSETNKFIEKEKLTNRVFTIRNSETPDIYPLYDGGETIGNACVNTMSVSKLLYDLFKEANIQDSFRVECTLNKHFNKWTPIKVVR